MEETLISIKDLNEMEWKKGVQGIYCELVNQI